MNRINKQITAHNVMVIDEDGNRLGTMTTKQAIEKAEADFKDLIEVSSSSSPPVCKIMEYGKFVYEQKKVQKQPKSPEMKEFRFGINIDTHDLQTKAKHITELLDKKHPIRVVIRFKGRENARIDSGHVVIDKLKLLVANGNFSTTTQEDKTLVTTIRKK